MKIVKKVLEILIVLFGVTILTFVFMNMSKVSPAEAIARRSNSEPTREQIKQIEKKYGFDQPIYKQYVDWVGKLLQGDFGTSYISNQPFLEEVGNKFIATLAIVLLSLCWTIVVAIPLGIISAVKKNHFIDHFIRGITILGISIPSFWFGFLLLVIFAIRIPIFKVIDSGNFKSMVLPSIAMALPITCSLIRMLRAVILENMGKDFVIYAKSRGLSRKNILLKHVMKNALPPIITLFFQNVGYMVAGSAIIESVFSWPGIGNYFVNAITQRDFPVINGCILIMACIYLFCNMLADYLNKKLNPRITEDRKMRLE